MQSRRPWLTSVLALAVSTAWPVVAAAEEAGGHPCREAPVATYDDRDRVPEVHRRSVDCAAHQRLMSGRPVEGGGMRFLPRRAVTRGQMATMLLNTLVAGGHDLRLSDGKVDRFTDIAGHPHRISINRLADAGIAHGAAGSSFSPDAKLRREQMASLLVAAAQFADPETIVDDGADRFTDVGDDNVHKPTIETGADSRLFTGTSATTFTPGAVVLRAPTATFAVTLLRRSAAADMLEPWEGFGRTTLELQGGDGQPTVRVPAYDAATPEARRQGLMDRESLRADAGMVFRFPGEHRGGFWMKNTTIPLSIAFFDGGGRIVAIMDMDPCTQDPCPTHDPGVPYHGALEVNQGFYEQTGITEGDAVVQSAALPPPT